MIRLLSSFLTNRHLRVHQDSAISNKIELKAGTPQGSALSPLLFIFYVNDTPKPPPGVLISKFADDMATWAIQKQEKRAEKSIQAYLDSLSNWCNKWKIKLNPSKTQVGLFTAYYSAAKTHLNKIQVIQNSALRIALRRNRRSHIEDLHEEGCLIPLKAEAARSSHRFMEKKVDDSLIQRLLLEHRIMLDYDRYKTARPSKTPIDLIPEYLETLL